MTEKTIADLSDLVEAGPPDVAMTSVLERAHDYATDDAYHALLDRLAQQLGAPARTPELPPDLSWTSVAGRFTRSEPGRPFKRPVPWWLRALPELGTVDAGRFTAPGRHPLGRSDRSVSLTLPPALPQLLIGLPCDRGAYEISTPTLTLQEGVLRIRQSQRWSDGRGTKERTSSDVQIYRVRGWLLHVQWARGSAYWDF